jgi:hypothetical protein
MLIYLEEAYITIKENTKTLLVASKETGLEVNPEKTKYMVVSRSECRTKSQYKDL